MDTIEIKPDIYWVGGVDWDLRSFHGYRTERGTTYNAYLIMDEEITLVDTVKHYLFDEMLARIEEIVDPSEISYIVSNHVEMDHSGSIPKILGYTDATVIASPRGKKGLQRHFKEDWSIRTVKSGGTLEIGERTLHFVHTPMVHWPDSMVTYSPHDTLLLPNDAFGQHIATATRFDDDVPWGILKEEAAKYYANIVMPYGSQVQKALDALADLEIDMIAPSHGVIWRTHLPKILEEYKKWARNETEKKALIVYDSMWGSTEKIAYALREGIEDTGMPVTMRNLKTMHISNIITDVLTSEMILLGSPTLNNTMLPTMGEFLTYLKGLKPKNRIGFVFGSYGWSGQAIGEIEETIKKLSWDLPLESITINYVPDEEELEDVKKKGRKLGRYLKKG